MLDNPVDLPRLTRSAPAPKAGIVHLGLGAFYRAFGAVYIQEAMNASGGDWGIIGVSLRSPGTRDALAPQDGVYTSVTQGPEGETAELIESVVELLVAPEDPAALLARLSDPAIKLVTLT
ncbi:MAG: mannitol dehydrogenase family protein, partial [Mangrovicoccus sp.]